MKKEKPVKISATSSNFEREPLIRPFGFKGGYLTEIWQTAVHLKSSTGKSATGLCSQSVLWSDSTVFSQFSESGGNALMFAVTNFALSLLKDVQLSSPVKLMDEILDEVYNYARKTTGNPNLRKTFVLNALVGVDNALWILYARENGFGTFDEMIPAEFREALSHRHKKVAAIPLMSYSVPADEIKQAVSDGFYFMKIKIGQPGTQDEMLEKDKLRLTEIHKAIGNYRTEHTKNGKLPYYLDANGRYQNKETLLKFIDHAEKIGALEQIAIIEEPFPEEMETDVSEIPVRLAADESAHTEKDALARIQMGYGAIALKAIAKTLSMSLKIALEAHRNNIPCFCADLTVNPILVEWNKNVAARLKPFPGLETGLLETNGHQNYKNWEKMKTFHPFPDASWRKVQHGVFELDSSFYAKSGGIFNESEHYSKLFGEV